MNVQVIWQHRTKILGYLQVAIGALAVADAGMVAEALGKDGLRWVMLTNGVLTAIVGHYNSRRAK